MNENENSSGQPSESLLGDELLDFCQSDSLSEEGVREIVERRNGFANDAWARFALHLACMNERVTEGIVQCLLEYFPDAAIAFEDGWSPLHCACSNRSVTLNIVRLLIDAAPDSLRRVIVKGRMPLHYLCNNKKVDEATANQILKLLIEKCPEAVRHADDDGNLPIHLAAFHASSPDYFRVLIEAYPGSEQTSNADGALPLHIACKKTTVTMVEYFCKLFPEATNHATTKGQRYPIHMAIFHRDGPEAALAIVQFLLERNPNAMLQKYKGRSLLHCACVGGYNINDSNIGAALEVIKIIYDSHPEAIEENRIASDIQIFHQQVQAFINRELVYAHQAKDLRLMTTPDDNRQLPLHTALQNDVRLGSIKLLVKGNPHAVQSPDNSGALPLHVACRLRDSVDIAKYLIELDTSTLCVADRDGNTALHFACRGAKYDTMALLLEKYDAVSVTKRNAQGKLPIDLLWESNAMEDRESVEYTESIFRLLKAHPETLMNNIGKDETQQVELICLSQVGKKRKI